VIVLAAAAGGLVWVWRGSQHVKGGIIAVASALLAAAVVRLVLPPQRAGMLACRRRFTDVLAFAVLGIGLLAAGLVLPPPS
jgi:hypothetical protein